MEATKQGRRPRKRRVGKARDRALVYDVPSYVGDWIAPAQRATSEIRRDEPVGRRGILDSAVSIPGHYLG